MFFILPFHLLIFFGDNSLISESQCKYKLNGTGVIVIKFVKLAESIQSFIFNIISKDIYSQIIECVGTETLSLKEIIEKLLNLIDKRRILLPIPLFFGKLSAKFFQLFPKPLLTEDQLKLLKYDNVISGKYKTNSDIGFPAKCLFEKEVEKYCYMWRQGGQFSKKKSISKN